MLVVTIYQNCFLDQTGIALQQEAPPVARLLFSRKWDLRASLHMCMYVYNIVLDIDI